MFSTQSCEIRSFLKEQLFNVRHWPPQLILLFHAKYKLFKSDLCMLIIFQNPGLKPASCWPNHGPILGMLLDLPWPNVMKCQFQSEREERYPWKRPKTQILTKNDLYIEGMFIIFNIFFFFNPNGRYATSGNVPKMQNLYIEGMRMCKYAASIYFSERQ